MRRTIVMVAFSMGFPPIGKVSSVWYKACIRTGSISYMHTTHSIHYLYIYVWYIQIETVSSAPGVERERYLSHRERPAFHKYIST